MPSNAEDRRFLSHADKYAAYLETPEGRLRLDLTFDNLQESLPQPALGLRALDIGGGTGALAMRLARLGIHVTLLDTSRPMLEMARRAAQEAGVTQSIALKYGDAAHLATLFDTASFDLLLCHNILEYVDDPRTVLRDAARVVRCPSGSISILVRNRAGEVLKAAIKDGDLLASENNLTAEFGRESLYGGTVRLFSAQSLQDMFVHASLRGVAVRGVRVVSDYLPPTISANDEYDRIFELERKLGRRPEFTAVARYTHWLAHPEGSSSRRSA